MRVLSPNSDWRHIEQSEGPGNSGPFFLVKAQVDSVGSTIHSDVMSNGKSGTMSFAELENRALGLEQEHRLEEARDAFDAGLQMWPASQSMAEGRARIALRLREDGAADHCARALAFRDDDPELQAQMLLTAAGEIGREAIPLFKSFLDRHPENVLVQEALADLQAQAGAGEGFLDAYTAALASQPQNKALLMSYWETLSRSRRYSQAIESMDANRHLFENDRKFAIQEISLLNYLGLSGRASSLLETLDEQPDAQLARGMNRLQLGKPDEAAKFLESVVEQQADNFEAWSLLEIAWRIDRKSTRLNSSHIQKSRMPSSA